VELGRPGTNSLRKEVAKAVFQSFSSTRGGRGPEIPGINRTRQGKGGEEIRE